MACPHHHLDAAATPSLHPHAGGLHCVKCASKLRPVPGSLLRSVLHRRRPRWRMSVHLPRTPGRWIDSAPERTTLLSGGPRVWLNGSWMLNRGEGGFWGWGLLWALGPASQPALFPTSAMLDPLFKELWYLCQKNLRLSPAAKTVFSTDLPGLSEVKLASVKISLFFF